MSIQDSRKENRQEAYEAGQLPYRAYVKGYGDNHEISFNDPIQGSVHDCSLVAAMSAIALSNPESIRNLIQDNRDGTYEVTLYERNPALLGLRTKRTVTVDVGRPDQLPARANELSRFKIQSPGAKLNGDILNGQQEAWPNIIESAAFKKLDFRNHLASEWMKVLTNKDVKTFKPTSQDFRQKSDQEVASLLKESLINRNPIVASTLNVPWSQVRESGVQPNGFKVTRGHAYVVTYVDKAGLTVNLRNPWGKDHIHGMPISEFRKTFDSVNISKLHPQRSLEANHVLSEEPVQTATENTQTDASILVQSPQALHIDNLSQEDVPVANAALFAHNISSFGQEMPDGSKIAQVGNYATLESDQSLELFEADPIRGEAKSIVAMNFEEGTVDLNADITVEQDAVFTAVNDSLTPTEPTAQQVSNESTGIELSQ